MEMCYVGGVFGRFRIDISECERGRLVQINLIAYRNIFRTRQRAIDEFPDLSSARLDHRASAFSILRRTVGSTG